MKSGSRHKTLKLSSYILLTLGMFLVVVVSLAVYIFQAEEANRVNSFRQQFFLLADELRQSSNDLTRMVRTYIATGDEKYKQNYQAILDIRDGIILRPVAYRYIYWDLLLSGELILSSQGEATPLLTLMSQAGFTEDEFALLATSKIFSDSLAETELAAIKLIESTSPPTEANRAQAINMLYDLSYHKAKAGIMGPIQQVFEMADHRTLNAVNAAEIRAMMALLAIGLFGASMMYLLWLTQRNMKAVLGGSINDVYAELSQLGRGDFSTTIPVPNDMKDSILGWLSDTQSKLIQLDAEHKLSEEELQGARRLESIGQLAAGLAHEINTPMQYVGDNTRFLEESFLELIPVLRKAEELADAVRSGTESSEFADELKVALREADADYLAKEIPSAIEQSQYGIDCVREIVQSMKEFSHSRSERMTKIDLNRSIEVAIVVSKSEWRYVAEVETDFDHDLPLVPCLPGEINQVILNLIVNAAHAIADVVGDGGGGKGTITISTRRDGDFVELSIADTGSGIPQEARGRVFEPFFTTKEVGEGTGQGLAIAHSIVVKKHGGTLDFTTEIGKGTTFILRLPLISQDAEESVD